MFKINIFAESLFWRKSAYITHFYGLQWCKLKSIPLRSCQKCVILANSDQMCTFQEGCDWSTVQNHILCVSATHEYCSNPSRNRVNDWPCSFSDEKRSIFINNQIPGRHPDETTTSKSSICNGFALKTSFSNLWFDRVAEGYIYV